MKMHHATGSHGRNLVPLHGLLHGRAGQRTYCIRRFDRASHNSKIHFEDFTQLAGRSRATKYRSNMEQVPRLIDTDCTFPTVEKVKSFRL